MEDLADHFDMPASQKLVVKSRNSSEHSRHKSRIEDLQKTMNNSLAFDMAPMAGRAREVELLRSAYHNESVRFAIIVGESGYGKTMLAKQLRDDVAGSTNAHFCLGKFDVHNRADPYHAIAVAMADLIKQIQADSDLLQSVKKDLESKFSHQDNLLLTELLPSFARISHRKKETKVEKKQERRNSKRPSLDDRGITDRGRRIQHVFVQFLQIVSKPEHPLIICLDDIQWMGKSCLSLIDTIMTAENLGNLFLVTTCRSQYLQSSPHKEDSGAIALHEDDEGNMLLDFLSKYSKQIRRLNLNPLKEKEVQVIINSLLLLPEDDLGANQLAAVICKKTGGNPYFVLEFMRLLKDEELLVFDDDLLKWTWMQAAIETLDVSSNVAQTVQKRFVKMESADLFVAQVASCISKTVDPTLLGVVIRGLKEEYETTWTDVTWPTVVAKNLKELQGMGVLETHINGRCYDFVHDQLQQACYKLIVEDRILPMKKCIGKSLIAGMNHSGQDQMLFTAVKLCGSAMKLMDEEEKQDFRFWAFLAGDFALQQGAAEFALSFFEKAIACLGTDPFKKDPELSLPLFSGAAEAAYCIFKCKEALEYIKLVKSQTGFPEIKKARVCLVEMKVHNLLAQRQLGLVSFCDFVNSLGAFKLSSTQPGIPTVVFQIVKTINALKKYNTERFLDLPESQNSELAASITAFSESLGALFLAGPNLFVVSTCKAMRQIVKHGVSTQAPLIFACFGTIVAGMGNRKRGLELGEVALELCEMHNYSEALPMSVQMVFGFVRPWLKPMGEFQSPVRYTLECATKNGQIELVHALFYLHVAMSIETQTGTLHDIIKEYEVFNPKHQDFKGGKGGVQTNIQFAYKLAYPSRDNTSLNGDIMNEETSIQFSQEFKEDFVPYMIAYFKLQLLMHLGDPVEAAQCSKMTQPLGIGILPGSHYAMRGHFSIGVANAMAYENTKRSKYLQQLKKMHKTMISWQKAGNPNVTHFVHFLDAEIFRARGMIGEAKTSYSKSLVLSRRLGFRFDAAFANERTCTMLKDTSTDEAREFLQEAISLYDEYGARTKVVHLKHVYRNLLSSVE